DRRLPGGWGWEAKARLSPPASVEYDEAVTRGPGTEPLVDPVGHDHPPLHRLLLQRLHGLVELAGLGVTVFEQPGDEAAQSQVLAVEHLEVQVGIDVRQGHVA